MVRSARRGLIRVAGLGLVAGLGAAAAMVTATLAMRAWAGVPLPVELASDRIVPTLSIGKFNQLARSLGGLVHGKEVAFRAGLATQFALALLGGAGFFLLSAWWERRSGPGSRPRSTLVLTVVLGAILVAEIVLLWPVLASNYRGLPPTPARVVASAGLLVSLLIFLLVAVTSSRLLSRPGRLAGAKTGVGSDPLPASAAAVSRRVLLIGAGSVAVAFGGAWLAGGLSRRATFGTFGYDGLQTKGPALDPVTPNDKFYVVTKNLIDPAVSSDLWRLSVQGQVDRPREYRLEELTSLPSVEQPTTLQCISNPVGGGLMSNAVWRGVSLRSLLVAARPRSDVERAVFHASDGYVHSTSLAKAMAPTTLLAYRMNGVPLPDRHGYPVRLVVPGTYGEVSVKWIDRIELVDHSVEGYYEKQGWRAQFVNTMSRIDRPGKGDVVRAGTTVVVRGVAFAGDRGVSGVEVSTDGGRSWEPAQIVYAASRLTWALWTLEWRPSIPGIYELSVRATDGLGDLQSSVSHGPAPAGATGYHRVSVTVAS